MIKPLIIFFGNISFIIAFVIHILIWRTVRPRKHLVWLCIVFIILPIFIYSTILFFSNVNIPINHYNVVFNFDIVFIILLHFTLSGAYIMSYPLMQAESPSLKIILAVSSSMPEGMTAESINNLFSSDELYVRLKDLVDEKFVYFKNNGFIISFKGHLLLSFFLAYRHLLGLPFEENKCW